jgi:2-dehydrotetronate isomerase
MPRFAANLTFLFPELPPLDRVAAARAAGFAGVEILFPYDDPAPLLLDRLDAAQLPLVLINGPPPNYTGGARGFAAVPGDEGRFRHDLRRATRVAATLGAQHVHLMAGVAEGEAARRALVENLRWACAAAPRQSFTIEPINRDDLPGYFLADFGLALEVIAEVGAPNLGLQFDAYHAQRITGDVMATWDRCRAAVRHVQIAGAPDRAEPIGGDYDVPAFLARLDADGYRGWVAAEYNPAGRTAAGLSWMRA